MSQFVLWTQKAFSVLWWAHYESDDAEYVMLFEGIEQASEVARELCRTGQASDYAVTYHDINFQQYSRPVVKVHGDVRY